jgi:type II secretory pathway pseudopilin PulG
MENHDSGLGGLLGILGAVALYSWGKSTGERRMHQQMSDAQRDKEIEQLKLQIEHLKQGK